MSASSDQLVPSPDSPLRAIMDVSGPGRGATLGGSSESADPGRRTIKRSLHGDRGLATPKGLNIGSPTPMKSYMVLHPFRDTTAVRLTATAGMTFAGMVLRG